MFFGADKEHPYFNDNSCTTSNFSELHQKRNQVLIVFLDFHFKYNVSLSLFYMVCLQTNHEINTLAVHTIIKKEVVRAFLYTGVIN